MKKTLVISESEKNRILDMHITASKNHYLNEQGSSAVTPVKPIETSEVPSPWGSNHPVWKATQLLSNTPISQWGGKKIGLWKTNTTDPNYNGEIKGISKIGEIHGNTGGKYGNVIITLDDNSQLSVLKQNGVNVLKITNPKNGFSYATNMLDTNFNYFM